MLFPEEYTIVLVGFALNEALILRTVIWSMQFVMQATHSMRLVEVLPREQLEAVI